jgi:hypothetical protein
MIQPVGTRPLFFIEEEHPLAGEQLHGITSTRAQEMSSLLLHQRRDGFPQESTGNL